MTNISIITAKPVFAEVIAALHARAFPDPWDADYLARLMEPPNSLTLIATSGSHPLGFILCQYAADVADIITLAVNPTAQRQGVAKALLKAVMKQLYDLGVDRLVLEVAVGNHPAWALYTGQGFEEVGRRRNYYQRRDGPEDAIVLARSLEATCSAK